VCVEKASASLKDSLESIKSKLKYVPLLLQLPVYKTSGKTIGSGSGVCGIVDLVDMRRIIFDESSKGRKVVVGSLTKRIIFKFNIYLISVC